MVSTKVEVAADKNITILRVQSIPTEGFKLTVELDI